MSGRGLRGRPTLTGVEFSEPLRDGVAAGRITVSYRLWKRPKVRVGGRYRSRSAGVEIEVDSIDPVPFGAIPDQDIRLSGERDRESLRSRAAHAGPIDDDTLLCRVEFHLVRDGPARAAVEAD